MIQIRKGPDDDVPGRKASKSVPDRTIDNTLAKNAFEIIRTGFADYCEAFATITQRAYLRFEHRDWHGMRNDTLERLDLYSKIIDETAGLLHRALGAQAHQRKLWPAIKSLFAAAFEEHQNAEIAYTFFNSVHRKIFNPVGIDPLLTFIDPPPQAVLEDAPKLFFTTSVDDATPKTLSKILGQYTFGVSFIDLEADARHCALRISRLIDAAGLSGKTVEIDMLKAPFFRGMSAYLVGRLRWSDGQHPLIFALDNEPAGLRVDALLSTKEEMRVLFSFSRAYFHVKTTTPGPVVTFLRELMPGKRIAELYISLGYHRHGKTELYLLMLQQIAV